jgi:hypothetical protein
MKVGSSGNVGVGRVELEHDKAMPTGTSEKRTDTIKVVRRNRRSDDDVLLDNGAKSRVSTKSPVSTKPHVRFRPLSDHDHVLPDELLHEDDYVLPDTKACVSTKSHVSDDDVLDDVPDTKAPTTQDARNEPQLVNKPKPSPSQTEN